MPKCRKLLFFTILKTIFNNLTKTMWNLYFFRLLNNMHMLCILLYRNNRTIWTQSFLKTFKYEKLYKSRNNWLAVISHVYFKIEHCAHQTFSNCNNIIFYYFNILHGYLFLSYYIILGDNLKIVKNVLYICNIYAHSVYVVRQVYYYTIVYIEKTMARGPWLPRLFTIKCRNAS